MNLVAQALRLGPGLAQLLAQALLLGVHVHAELPRELLHVVEHAVDPELAGDGGLELLVGERDSLVGPAQVRLGYLAQLDALGLPERPLPCASPWA
jgi:hypothetical protein